MSPVAQNFDILSLWFPRLFIAFIPQWLAFLVWLMYVLYLATRYLSSWKGWQSERWVTRAPACPGHNKSPADPECKECPQWRKILSLCLSRLFIAFIPHWQALLVWLTSRQEVDGGSLGRRGRRWGVGGINYPPIVPPRCTVLSTLYLSLGRQYCWTPTHSHTLLNELVTTRWVTPCPHPALRHRCRMVPCSKHTIQFSTKNLNS